VGVEGDGADGALFVAAMMLGGVFVFFALLPGFALAGGDEVLGITEGDAVFLGESLRAFGNQHHVGADFVEFAGEADGIADALDGGDRAGAERGAVHDDGVAFDAAVEIEMRAVTGVEHGIVFEDDDSGFHGVEPGAAAGEDRPAGVESALAAGLASFDGVVGDVPRTAVNDEGGSHQRIRIARVRVGCKGGELESEAKK